LFSGFYGLTGAFFGLPTGRRKGKLSRIPRPERDLMKTVQYERFGPAHEVCACIESPDPGPPGAGEVVVRVEAFPINPVDLLTIAGTYATRPDLPAVPGSEGVGVVEAVGGDVASVAVGDRVLLMGRDNWRQLRVCKEAEVLKVDIGTLGDIDIAQLAMLKINPATAALMLRRYADLKPGDWVIQNAANSGVGTNLIRLAKAGGFRTVNVIRRDSLIEPLKAIGADVVVVDGGDLAERVGEATGGADIRLGIDAVAGHATLRLSECLADGGSTLVNYGLLSGDACMVTPHKLVFGGVTLTGFWLVNHLGGMTAGEKTAFYAELAGLLADGTLKTEIEAVYPIEAIRKALGHAGLDGRDGKILVAPNGPISV